MPTVEKLIIEVSGDDRKLDPLLNKLEKAGDITRDNARDFKKTSDEFIAGSKKRDQALKEEIEDLEELERRKKRAFNPKDVREYTARIEESKRKIKDLGGEVKKQQQNFSKTDKILGKLGTTIAGVFAVERLISFGVEAVKISARAEGIKTAFDNLNDPTLLDDLKKATRGAVTEVKLMEAAVKAENFKIPLNQLADFFEFATNRSIQTGESVDFLVESIINGIGRKSSLVLDNLGISVSELQQEIKLTGDFAVAAGNIIQRELKETGDVADTTAIKLARLNAEVEDAQEGFGAFLISIAGTGEFLASTPKLIDQIKEAQIALNKEVNTTGIEYGVVNDEVKELLKEYEKLKDDAPEQRRINSAKELSERLSEAEKALNKQVSGADRAAARFGIETKAVTELLEQYELYVDRRTLTQEEFIAKHQEEFKEFAKRTDQLIEEEKIQRLVNEARREWLDLQKEVIQSRKSEDQIADEIFEEQLERESKEAERFDKFQKSIQDKKERFAREDRERAQRNLEADAEIAQAQIDLANNTISAFAAAANQGAEFEKALIIFDKLAAISKILINLQVELSRNRATLPLGVADAANARARANAAISVSSVLATAVPELALADGDIDIRGPGTETSDSIRARLSKGESVMTAKETRMFKSELLAMRNKTWDKHILEAYQIPAIKDFIMNNNIAGNDFNDLNILRGLSRNTKELRGIRKELANKTSWKPNLN